LVGGGIAIYAGIASVKDKADREKEEGIREIEKREEEFKKEKEKKEIEEKKEGHQVKK
jgi:sugar phosphate permease